MIRYSVPVLVFMSVPVHVTSPVSEPVLYLFVCLNLYVAVAVASHYACEFAYASRTGLRR